MIWAFPLDWHFVQILIFQIVSLTVFFLTETIVLPPCCQKTPVVAAFIGTEVNGHFIATAPQDTRFLFAAALPKLFTETVSSVSDFEIIIFAFSPLLIGDWVLKLKVCEVKLYAWSRFHFQVIILLAVKLYITSQGLKLLIPIWCFHWNRFGMEISWMNVENLSLGYFEGYEGEVTFPLAHIPPIVQGLKVHVCIKIIKEECLVVLRKIRGDELPKTARWQCSNF